VTVRALDNAEWGFDSNCFVCEQKNAHGLRIPFTYNDETGVIGADFSLGDTFSGAPTYVHGGVTLAILDEAMSWATIAAANAFAVTQTTTTNFLRPVKVGRAYRVEAKVDGRDGDLLTVSAVVTNEHGKRCAEATARFVQLSMDQAESALGTTPTGSDAGYVKGG
jgi:acyl-coenzyme A thioesterase PaaI-like protein